jgi:hypothetical protein
MDTIKTGNFKTKAWIKQSRWFTLTLVLIVVAAVSVFVVNSQTVSNICTQEQNLPLLSNAARAISSNDVGGIITDAQKITKLPNYSKDPNCDYVLFQWSERTFNISQAQTYLNFIKSHYPIHGLYHAFGSPKPSAMQSELNNYAKLYKALKSRAVYLTPATPKH